MNRTSSTLFRTTWYGLALPFLLLTSGLSARVAAQETSPQLAPLPKTEAPQQAEEAPKTEAPKTEAPKTEAPAATLAVSQLSIEAVDRRLKEVDILPNLDDAAKEELRGVYRAALADLAAAEEFNKQASIFVEMVATAADRLQKAQFQKAAMAANVTIDVPPDSTLGKLEGMLKAEEEQLAEAKRRVEQWKSEPGRRQARRTEISTKLPKLRELHDRLVAELTAAQGAAGQGSAAGTTTDAKTAAATTRQRSRIQAAFAEIQLYDKEQAAFTATREILPLELELAERNASFSEKRVALWRAKVEQQRMAEVQQQEMVARLEAERAQGALRPLAERNRKLAEESSELVKSIQDVNQQLQEAGKTLEKTQQQFTVTQEKVKRVGLNYAIGLLLRKEDSSLPDVSKYKHSSRGREETIRRVQLRIIDLAVERSASTDVDYVENYIANVDSLPPGISRDEFASAVTSLIEKELQLLTTLQQNLDSYFERLVDLESTEQQLRKAVAEYGTYIDERVLWIRSSEPIAPTDIRNSVIAFQWFSNREAWSATFGNLAEDCLQRFLPFMVTLLVWLVLLLFQPRLRRAVTHIGEQAASGSCRRFLPTGLALTWTLLIAALWPMFILILAWRLDSSAGDENMARALSRGLTMAGLYYVTLDLLRQVCRSKGLAESHFGWPQGVRVTLRTNLRWLMSTSIPMVFAAAMLYADAGDRSQDSLGLSRAQESAARLFMITILALAVLFVHQTLRPDGNFYRSLAADSPESSYFRFRRLTYGAIMLVLGSLLALATIGYDYTVVHLARRLYESVLLLQVLLVVMSLINRWLIVLRRRMAIEQAQQRRAQIGTQGEVSGTLASMAITETAPDLVAIGEQSRRLLQSLLVICAVGGLWYIWRDVIPALNILERFELWNVVNGGVETTITANHVVLAIVIVGATVLATRNIPGLLEIAVLSRLPLDAGNRYAIITICRYVLTIMGMIFAFGAIGISWSSYQWLVGALTVGLGFGLQEIFANFVSGIIVLFEQPVRVGDIVTIGDVTGVVSKIRMRATTVTNWDRQELIVPNREFITGRLLNWTLSNTVNRVVVTVGVAYGTDPDVVKQILLDIAQQHPVVLGDPEPTVTFSEFGDSTLNIVLRCYLPDLEDRLATIHDLNTAAQKRLNEAGIEFAFPTRELIFPPSEVNRIASAAEPLDAVGAAALSTTGQPTTGQPTTGQPTTGQPTTGQPTTGQSSTGQSTTGQSSTGQSSTGQPQAS